MAEYEYQRAREQCDRIALEVGQPRFYLEKAEEVALSREKLTADPLMDECLRMVEMQGDCLGHGLQHVLKVAVDAGAIILIETKDDHGKVKSVLRLVFLAHLAGLLHDIRRQEKNHAVLGAEAAENILLNFPVTGRERLLVAQAIRNHEAFQEVAKLCDDDAQLLSDALYDADKFRWGPDNFTETIWAMLETRGIPLNILMAHFLTGLEGVRRIRETFRTETGKYYGPDFIDLGLEIGRRLYEELKGPMIP
jgi:hypothetical protein